MLPVKFGQFAKVPLPNVILLANISSIFPTKFVQFKNALLLIFSIDFGKSFGTFISKFVQFANVLFPIVFSHTAPLIFTLVIFVP